MCREGTGIEAAGAFGEGEVSAGGRSDGGDGTAVGASSDLSGNAGAIDGGKLVTTEGTSTGEAQV